MNRSGDVVNNSKTSSALTRRFNYHFRVIDQCIPSRENLYQLISLAVYSPCEQMYAGAGEVDYSGSPAWRKASRWPSRSGT